MNKGNELVVLRRDVPAHGLKAGDVGVVVEVYPEGGLDVEFVNAGGTTLAVLTFSKDELRPMAGSEILHVRAVA
jgi:hypothetical protein